MKRRRDKRRRYKRRMYTGTAILVIILIVLIINGMGKRFAGREYFELSDEEITAEKPEIDVQLLDVNPYSRPGTETGKIKGIVVHYTANPGATAMQNRNYFQGLKDSHQTEASSHFIIGLEGEIVQCVPTWEVAYASNERNKDTVSIENCHRDESGNFTKETYQSLVQLTSWLCQKFELTEEDVIRHYDVTGKICPKQFVESEDTWERFRADIKAALENQK